MSGTRRRLNDDERTIVEAIAEIVAPQDPDGPIRTSEPVDAADATAAIVEAMPPHVQTLTLLGFRLLDLLPLAILGAPRRMHRLDVATRTRYLTKLADHPLYGLRMLFKGSAGLVMSAYFADPRVHAAIGYLPERGPGWPAEPGEGARRFAEERR
ncbi:MAG: hypothetical protein KC466_11970 [Myxococcales bacterium]|nr:hypothetical protein [Myxococcales bacterium]